MKLNKAFFKTKVSTKYLHFACSIAKSQNMNVEIFKVFVAQGIWFLRLVKLYF